MAQSAGALEYIDGVKLPEKGWLIRSKTTYQPFT